MYHKNINASGRTTLLTLVFTVICLVNTYGNPGGLDPSFGSAGKATLGLSNSEWFQAVVVQADGRIVTTGSEGGLNNHTLVVRYNSDGTRDNSFAQDGIFTLPNLRSQGVSIAIQPDGKIVVASESIPNATLLVFRLNPNGSLDNSFGHATPVIIDFTPGNDIVRDMLLQPDGKIVVAGGANDDGFFGGGTVAVARLNFDGSFDTGFDSDGKIITAIPGIAVSKGQSVAEKDGKLVVSAGAIDNAGIGHHALFRYLPDGQLDPSFGSGGVALTSLGVANLSWSNVAVGNDGRIIATGSIGKNTGLFSLVVYAYLDNGTLDNDFASDGNALLGVDCQCALQGLKIQSNGKIVVAGHSFGPNRDTDILAARLNLDGSLDKTFGNAGRVLLPFGPSADRTDDLTLQPDGKLLIVGQANYLSGPSTNFHAMVFRLLGGEGKSAFDFDADGKTDIAIFRPGIPEWWLTNSLDGRVSATQFGAPTDIPAPADFTGDGKTDVALFRPSTGQWYILRSDDNSYLAFPFGTNGDVPAPADFDGDGKADASVYRPSNGTWFILQSGGGTTASKFGGQDTDRPAVADYDGDGRADISIVRLTSANMEWWVQRSTSGISAVTFGMSSDLPVPGDYTGDGKTDLAVFRPSTGFWFILKSDDGSLLTFPWGIGGDIPIGGDFDGDGKWDATVFRPSTGTWLINRTTAGSGPLMTQFGQNLDIPVPAVFSPARIQISGK